MRVVSIFYMVLCPLCATMPLRFPSPRWKVICNSSRLTNYYLNRTQTQMITYLKTHKEDLYDS